MNRRMRRLQQRHGIKATIEKTTDNKIEFKPEKPITAKMQPDYDENGEVRGYFINLVDENGNQIDAREIVSAMYEVRYENI